MRRQRWLVVGLTLIMILGVGQAARGPLARLLTRQGEVYALRGDSHRAVSAHSWALRLGATAERYALRGRAYEAQARYAEALADYSRALALLPERAQLYTRRALTYYALGDLSAALADLNRALTLDPGDAESYLFRALVGGAQGETRLAVEDYLAVLSHTADPQLRYQADEGLGMYGLDACELHCPTAW